jgi:hypothetical protein
VTASTSIFTFDRIEGGSGGSTFGPQGGDGGPGAIVSNGSRLVVRGQQLVGGTPGSGSSNAGTPGPRDIVDATSSLTVHTGRSPIAVLTAPFTVGGTAEIRYPAAGYFGPDTPAVLLSGTRTSSLPLPTFAVGVLGVDPIVTLGPLFAAAGTWHSSFLAVPATFPRDFPLAFQIVSWNPIRNELAATNAVATTSR